MGHLSQSHADFFKKQERLIALEEQDTMRFKKELWTLNAGEQEILDRCFADMAFLRISIHISFNTMV